MQGAQNIAEVLLLPEKSMVLIMYDSVLTGKENASKD